MRYLHKFAGRRDRAFIAIRLDANNLQEVVAIAFPFAIPQKDRNGQMGLVLLTKDGSEEAYRGDWIIKYPDGNVSAMRDEDFTARRYFDAVENYGEVVDLLNAEYRNASGYESFQDDFKP